MTLSALLGPALDAGENHQGMTSSERKQMLLSNKQLTVQCDKYIESDPRGCKYIADNECT